MMQKKFGLAILVSLFILPALFAQDTGFLDTAMTLYGQNRYQEAYDLIVQKVPEATAAAALKTASSQTLTDIGTSEYKRRNFKNAYECFKKALKFVPTNSVATQSYLKIKKEQDVNNLKNEWVPPVTAAPPAITEAPSATPSGTDGTTGAAGTVNAQGSQGSQGPQGAQPAVTSAVTNENINALLQKLDTTANQLTSLQSSDQATRKENEYLRSQIEQQRGMLQQIQVQQAKAPATIVTSAPAVSAENQAVIQQTLKLLGEVTNKLVEQQNNPVAPAPAASIYPQWLLIALVSFILVLILGLVLVVLFLFARAKSRRNAQGRDVASYSFPMETSFLGSPSVPRPMLDFRSEGGGREERSLSVQDSGLKRDLLKADHLNRLYEEVRNGTLSWETVRKYIGEMEVELKASILKIVEAKLDEGDLVSNEAILPVLFPFLNDYDAFIREKSEKLAHSALTSSTGGGTETKMINEDAGPFDVKMLMAVPEKLKTILKGNDQSLVVAKLSRGIAKHLGMSSIDCQDIYRASLAHDAGYLMLDQERLQKIIAKTEITDEDMEFIQSHTIKGSLYFGELEIPENIRGALLYHHERNDGSGYPEGLRKDAIPVFAKIIGVSETFAALIARRPQREKVEYTQALAIVRDSRTKFDREIIDALCSVVQSSGSFK